MKRGFWVLFFALINSLAFGQNAHYAQDQLFLKLKDDFNKELPLFDEIKTFNAPEPISDREVNKVIGVFNTYKVVANKKTSRLPSLTLNKIYTIRVEDTSRIANLIVELSKLPFIDYVERVPMYSTEYTPNDLSPNQWNLTKTKVPQAWDLSRGLSTVVIAIVDDAVRLNHEDLAANIWVNPKEIPNNGIDDDSNGYIDDINGYDVADNDNNPTTPSTATNSEFTHGTHCAGIASARADNSRGIASPGFSCKIMAVKTKQSSDRGPSLPYAYEGLEYAISSGAANVISLSWGGYGRSNTFQLLINYAYSRGIVIVAAAGNSNTNTPFYPASYNHVISVGATDINDQRAFFSNYGTTVDIMAPGLNIWSTFAGSPSSYGYLSGTSMACPLVSGICGLMLSYAPGSSPDFIESCLKSNADNINGLNPGYVGQLGAGRINAQAALACLRGIPIADFIATTTSVCVGQSVNFYDKSLGNAIYAWNWTFSGANINTSTAKNPTVTYLSPGTYSIGLTVTNNGGSNTISKQGYITVYQPAASISGSATISAGQSTPLRFDFSGNIPFSVVFSDGTNANSISGINSTPYFAYVSPSVTKTYTISSFADGNCAGNKRGNAIISVSTVTSPCQNCTTNTGLVAYYPFCGNANDVSGNGNNGTISGSTFGTDRFGNASTAAVFNGGTECIKIPRKIGQDFTISAWFKTTNSYSNQPYWINGGSIVDAEFWGCVKDFGVSMINGGKLAFGVGDFTTCFPSSLITTNDYNDGAWHMVTATRSYTDGKLSLYIDGVFFNSIFSYINILDTSPFIGIGRNTGDIINAATSYSFIGSIDDIKIFDRILTPLDIQNLYNEPAPCTSTGLVASYPFCGNANDVSGSGINGTVSGATLTIDRFGNSNSAYAFNGINNSITFSNVPTTATDNWAISAWISLGSLSQAGIAISQGYDDITNAGISNGYSFGIGNGSNTIFANGGNLMGLYSNLAFYNTNYSFSSTSSWCHVVMQRNSGILNFYVNGVKLAYANTVSPFTPTSFTIGSQNGVRYFNGKIDDVKIYNKALSDAEILNLYNEPAPCTIKPIASYPFCGNANDVSGNGNNGKIVQNVPGNTGAILSTDRFNQPNSCYYFDGTYVGTSPNQKANYIDIGSAPGLKMNGNQISISCWINSMGPDYNSGRIVLGGSVNAQYTLVIESGKILWRPVLVNQPGNFNTYEIYSNTNISTNAWYHIVAMYDGTKSSVYINGTLDKSVFTNGELLQTSAGVALIGGEDQSHAGGCCASSFNGKIDDVKIYNKALSITEIQNLYNEPAPCTSTGLVASYPFCGNANDVSGNNYDGTVTGVVLTNDRFGNANSAYYFNGSGTSNLDNNIKFNAPYGNSQTPFTLALWAKSDPDITTVRDYPVIANFYNSNPSLIGENVRTSWANLILGNAYPANQKGLNSIYQSPQSGGIVQLNSTTIPSVNVWNHFVYTYDPVSNVIQMFINGKLNNSILISGTANPKLFTSLIIGREYDGGNNVYSDTYFKGSIDDIKIYSRVLTSTEVLSLYNEPAPCTSTGLVASYPFCGNANDVSGNNYTGTVTGASLATDRFGNANSAYFFNGSNYIRTSFPGISGTNARTLNFWIKPSSSQQNSYQYLGSYGLFQNGGYDMRCGINFNQPGQASLDISDGAIAKQTNNLYDGNWHMVTYAIPANTVLTGVKIYLDGNLLTVTSGVCCSGSESTTKINTLTTAVTTSSANLFNFNIGVLFTGNYNSPTLYGYYNGYLDDISIYNYQLTQSQIQALFNAPAPCTSDSLVLYYPFCKNPNDLTKFANNGTSSGANLTKDRFGYTESAYNFNGTNSFIESPLSTSLGIGNAGTISLWARRSNWSNLPLEDKEFINNNYAYPNANNLYLSFHYGQGIHFRFKNGGFDFVSSNIHTTWQDNSWHHIVGKWEPNGTNTRISLYADGVLLATKTISGTINVASTKWNLGKYLTATHQEWFDGDLDDVRIYNKAITATTIATLFNESAQCITCLTTVTPAIVGNTTICNSGVESYSISSIAGISYTWSVTGNNNIRQNGNQATVTWAGQGIFALSGIPSGTCVGISKLTVTVGCCTLTPVKADFVVNTNSCTGQGFSLTNTSINTSLASTYVWSFGPDAVPSQSTVTNPAFVYFKTPGRKVITLKVTGPGCRQTDTKSDTIFFFPVPIANAGPDIYLCTTLGQSLGSNGISDNRYVWHPGTYVSDSTQSQPTLTKFYNGPLVLEVRYGESNCIGYDTVQVYQYPAVSQDKAAICKGDVVTLKAASWNTKGLYTWKPSTYIYQDLGGTVVVNPDKDTTFTLSINSISGCSIATAKILVEQPYVLKVSYSPVKYCINDTLSLKVANPRSNFEYTWFKHADSTISTKGISAKFLYAKPNIQAKAVENGICKNTVILPIQGLDSTFATVHTPVVESICIEPTLTISSSLAQNRYKWSDGSASNSTKAMTSGLYWVKTYNFCEEHTDSFYVTIRNVENYYPNIFSPNDDQKNDVLVFQGCAFHVGDVSLEVFNRLGEIVYSTKAYKQDWTAKGLPSGMYFYILKNSTNDEITKGWLQIVK